MGYSQITVALGGLAHIPVIVGVFWLFEKTILKQTNSDIEDSQKTIKKSSKPKNIKLAPEQQKELTPAKEKTIPKTDEVVAPKELEQEEKDAAIASDDKDIENLDFSNDINDINRIEN